MRSISIAGTLVLGFALLAACAERSTPTAVHDGPLFRQAPADGNGNKEVIPIDLQFSDFATCEGGATLDVHLGGWVQVFSQRGERNFELSAIKVVFTYSNAAGETFVWHEVGIDQFYIDENGALIHVVLGRAGGFGVIGRLVINEATGEVTFVAGKEVFANDLACDALT